MGKVIGQMKLEKANLGALHTQNDELKKLIIKIGVNPKDKTTIQFILQGVESKIQLLRRKLKLPATKHVLAPNVAQIEKEKEIKLMNHWKEIRR